MDFIVSFGILSGLGTFSESTITTAEWSSWAPRDIINFGTRSVDCSITVQVVLVSLVDIVSLGIDDELFEHDDDDDDDDEEEDDDDEVANEDDKQLFSEMVLIVKLSLELLLLVVLIVIFGIFSIGSDSWISKDFVFIVIFGIDWCWMITACSWLVLIVNLGTFASSSTLSDVSPATGFGILFIVIFGTVGDEQFVVVDVDEPTKLHCDGDGEILDIVASLLPSIVVLIVNLGRGGREFVIFEGGDGDEQEDVDDDDEECSM